MTTNVVPQSISYSWENPECGKRNGEIVTYTFEITNDRTNDNINDKTTDSIVTINNLTPYVTYTFKVAALNTAGMGPFSEIVTRTAEGSKYLQYKGC